LNTLYLVIPCYNEEAVLRETAKRTCEKLLDLTERGLVSDKSRIMFCNDGSKDATWEIIKELHGVDGIFCGLNISRNRGHQNVVMAGLMQAKALADYVITMDADLQDDINAIDEMVIKANDGCDVVYGVRSSRKSDTFFKKATAEGFYRLMKAMGVDIVFNHADFRLMSRRVLECLSEYKEVSLFLRGIIPLIGYKSDVVYYERAERFAGESKYPLKKMLSFAWDGITSFSSKPLKILHFIGSIFIIIAAAILIYTLFSRLRGNYVPGWASVMCSVWFVGGVVVLSLGIIGEYIGKIFMQTKERPHYHIDTYIGD